MARNVLAHGIGMASLVVVAAAPAMAAPPGTTQDSTVFVYKLDVPGTFTGYFSSCTGLGSQNKAEKGREDQRRGRGRLVFVDLVCIRGLTSNPDLWNWRSQVEQGEPAQKDGTFSILDETFQLVAQWQLSQAWPREVTLGEAAGNIAHERVSLQYEDERRTK